MLRIFCLAIILISAITVSGAEKSYSIVFGNDAVSTTTLDNKSFLNSIKQGSGYVEKATSVIHVFPSAKDYIQLSSNSANGGFNIWLTENAQVVAKRIEFEAARFDSNNDADASIMLNNETFYITETLPYTYTLEIPSRPAYTLTNIIVHAEHRVKLYSITVWYDDSQGTVDPDVETVATPIFIPGGGTITAGTLVNIECATADAEIHYTIDGTIPTSASAVYSESIAVYNDLTIKAFAIKKEMNASEVAEATFTVRNPEATLTSYFDFHNPASLNPALSEPELKEWILLDGRTFTDGETAILFTACNEGNTHVRLFNSYDAGCDVRIYSGDCVTVSSMHPNIFLKKIEFEVSESSGSDVNLSASCGEYNYLSYTWDASDDNTGSVDFTANTQSRLKSMTVYLETNIASENLPYDHDRREEWYTIDGYRVPTGIAHPGFYIRKSIEGSDKIIIK